MKLRTFLALLEEGRHDFAPFDILRAVTFNLPLLDRFCAMLRCVLVVRVLESVRGLLLGRFLVPGFLFLFGKGIPVVGNDAANETMVIFKVECVLLGPIELGAVYHERITRARNVIRATVTTSWFCGCCPMRRRLQHGFPAR